MARPITICHIILRLDFGGLENGLVMLLNHLPEDRYRHILVCLERATDFQNRIRRGNVTIHEIGKKPGKDLSAYWKVWRLLRAQRPDIVHTRNLPAVDMFLPAVLAGVPGLVHSEHGLDMVDIAGSSAKYKLLRKLSSLAVDRYVAVSKDLQRWMVSEVGLPTDRVSVIYNGVDSERFRPGPNAAAARASIFPPGFAPPNTFVIGTIGRLEPIKDQTNLVCGFLNALKERPALREMLRLVVIGEGRLRAEMEALLEAEGAAPLAWMPGFRNDVAELYRTFDLFALPSRREGTSNTILEAMASGLPVVATDVGGNPELVTPGVTGRLVPPEDSNALGDAILEYADQPPLAKAHGAAGRDRILRDFSIEAMVAGYDVMYCALAEAIGRNHGS